MRRHSLRDGALRGLRLPGSILAALLIIPTFAAVADTVPATQVWGWKKGSGLPWDGNGGCGLEYEFITSSEYGCAPIADQCHPFREDPRYAPFSAGPQCTMYTVDNRLAGGGGTWFICPYGGTPVNGQCVLDLDVLRAEKNLSGCGTVGNPCNPATGNKYQTELDYRSSDESLSFTRHHNSQLNKDLGLGFGWTSPFNKRLEISGTTVQIREGSGRGEPFICPSSTGTCSGDSDTLLALSKDTAGYTLLHKDGAIERYDLNGWLLTDTDRAGKTTSFTYTNGQLATVTGPFGHVMSLGYSINHFTSMTDPNGGVYSYSYDGNNNLIRVTYPDGSAKHYHYENVSFPHHLTGISYQEAGGTAVRYSTYGYDTNGKAVLTEHAAGLERYTLQYDSDTQTTVRDAINTPDVMTFAANLGVKNLVSKVNQVDGKGIVQTFDTNNKLTCKKDEEGRVTTYSYNSTNQRLSQTEGLTGSCGSPTTTSATRTTNYQYLSSSLDLPTQIQSPSVNAGQTKIVTIAYDTNRNPTTITQSGFTSSDNPVSRSLSLSYNPKGQVTSIDGPRGDVADITTLAYNNCTTGSACGRLASITNALGHTTTFDSYDGAGRVTQSTDANGLRTHYSYDGRGRVSAITQTPPSGSGSVRTTQYSYNSANNLTVVTFPDGRTVGYSYDAAQKLRQVTDNLGNKITYNYDLKGNRTQEQVFDPDNTLVRAIDTAYDLRNRTASINAGGSLTQTINDAVGNLVSQTDPKNNPPTAHQYDALNRLIQTLDALGGTTGYGYDIGDRLTRVQAPNNATTQYQYDDLGNLLQEVSGDRGTTTYTYDTAGNVKTITDARGITTTYTYDALNRVTVIDYPGANEDVTLTYDTAPAGSTTPCAFGIGRLCQAVDESGATQYAYDPFGNVSIHAKTELGVTYATRYTLDAGDRVSAITYPDNRIVIYARDNLGRIQSITATVNGSPQTIINNRAYRADGLFLSQTYGNGLNEIRQYDLKGQLTYQSLGSADTRLYSYDPNGNLTQKQSLPAVGNYVYDALDRLTGETQGLVSGAITYDGNGNRLSASVNTISATLRYAPATNRLTGVTLGPISDTFTLDAAGNHTSVLQGKMTLDYNNAGRLMTVRAGGLPLGRYTYNAQGLRTRKTAGLRTTVFHYDLRGTLIAETQPNGALIRAYVYADTTPVAQITKTTPESLVYLHTDHLDTPRVGTNSNQTVVWRWEADAFGVLPPQSDPDGDGRRTVVNLRFPGQYADSETGLHYNWHRYYDPKTGRYLSSDPIGLRGGLNTYLYARANPLRYTDPSGLLPVFPPEVLDFLGDMIDVGIGATVGIVDVTVGTGGVDVSLTTPGLGAGVFACINLCNKPTPSSSCSVVDDPPIEPLPLTFSAGPRRLGVSFTEDGCTICGNFGPAVGLPVNVSIPIK